MIRLGATFLTISICCSSFASTTLKQIEELKNNKNKWSVSISTEMAGNTQDKNTSAYSSYSEFLVLPTYNYNDNYALTMMSGVVKEFSGEQQTLMTNTIIGVKSRTNVNIIEGVLSFPSISMTLPTNDVDRRDNTFMAALTLSSNFIKSTDIAKWPVTLVYGASYKKNVHKYETNASFAQNISQILSQSLAISTDINKIINISVAGAYKMGLAYNDNFLSTYSLSESINFDLSDKNYLSLGHVVGGNALAYNGRDLDIKAFDAVNSQFFINYSKTY